MSKEPRYVTHDTLYEEQARLYEAFRDDMKALEDRVYVLEALTRGMRLPDELDIAGQTYVKKDVS